MDTLGVVDLSALYEGIQDELVAHKVIKDDNCWIVRSHDGSEVFHDKNNPRMEITITAKGKVDVNKTTEVKDVEVEDMF